MTFEAGMVEASYMDRALQLAALGMNSTMPNPRVGCVLVRDGVIVGEGWHARAGEPHAEVHALRAAGEKARGSTAYVTLEPCNHTGRTPPCTDALVLAGVSRVVVAMQDPNPLVSGRGIERLQAAGIHVDVGLRQRQAETLNVGFVSRMVRGRPWIRAKVAMSLDGRTALANGASQWITGEAARADGHRLRARSCAMMTGTGTVRRDDPELTVRHVESPRQPIRIVLDNRLETPLDAKVLRGNAQVWLLTVCEEASRARPYQALGAEVVVLPAGINGRVDFLAMARFLGERGLNEVTVETGSRLLGPLLEAGILDEFVFYVAPALLGEEAAGVVQVTPLQDLSRRFRVDIASVDQVGEDWRIVARTKI